MKKLLSYFLLTCLLGMLCCSLPAYAQSIDGFWLKGEHPQIYDATYGYTYHVMSHGETVTLRLDVSDVATGKNVWLDAAVGTKNRASIAGTYTTNFWRKLSGTDFTQESGIHDDISFTPSRIEELQNGAGNGIIRFFGINSESKATGFLRANLNNESDVVFDVYVVDKKDSKSAEVVNATYNSETGNVRVDTWALSYYGANGIMLYLIPEYLDAYHPQLNGDTATVNTIAEEIKGFNLWEKWIPRSALTWGYDYAAGNKSAASKIYHPNVNDVTRLYPYLQGDKPFYDCFHAIKDGANETDVLHTDDNTGRYNGQFYIAVQGHYLNGETFWGVTRPVVLADALIPELTIQEKTNEALSTPNASGTVYGGTEGLLTCEVGNYISHSATGRDFPGTLTYQWYTKETDGTYTEIEGATESSFTVPDTLALGSYTYACKVTNSITQTGENRVENANVSGITVTDTEEAMQEFVVNVERKPVPYPTAKNYSYNGVVRIGITPESFEGFTYNAESITHATLPGTYAATAKLNDNYCWADGSLADYSLTWTISPVSGLDCFYVSPFTNTATPEAMKLAIRTTATNAGITLPDNFIASYVGGNGIATDSGGYDVSGNAVWGDLLGKVDDKMDMVLSVDGVDCVTGTFTVTTGQDYVFGNNTSEWENPLSIIKYGTPNKWTEDGTDAYIKAQDPETVVVRAYLRPNQKILVETEIGMYYGRTDVTITKEKDDTVQATDHIDAFFPVSSVEDDYFISKLPESGTAQKGDSAYADMNNKNTSRGDYWYNVNPFVVSEEGLYCITFQITGESYLLDYIHGLGAQYGKNPGNNPANAPQTTFKRISIQPADAKEQHGIDA